VQLVLSDLPCLLHALMLLHKLVQAVYGCDRRPVMQLPLLQPKVCRQGKGTGVAKSKQFVLHTACLCVPCCVAVMKLCCTHTSKDRLQVLHAAAEVVCCRERCCIVAVPEQQRVQRVFPVRGCWACIQGAVR
jgi:hypothetical protein